MCLCICAGASLTSMRPPLDPDSKALLLGTSGVFDFAFVLLSVLPLFYSLESKTGKLDWFHQPFSRKAIYRSLSHVREGSTLHGPQFDVTS